MKTAWLSGERTRVVGERTMKFEILCSIPVGPDVCMNNKNFCFRVLDFSLHYLYKYVCLLYLQQVCLSLGLFRLVTRMSLDIYLIGQTTLRAMATK